MARVIGTDPKVEKEISCRGCGSKIAYVQNDVKRHDGTDYSGGPDGREWIDCPSCGEEITIRSW